MRAAYRPTGFNNDEQNNIVHVEVYAYAWIWFPWVLAIVVAGMIAYYWRAWRARSRTPASRWP